MYYGSNLDLVFDNIDVAEDWKDFFESCKEDLAFIKEKLQEKSETKYFLPTEHNVFRIFRNLSPNEIKVVLIGQDPYPEVKTRDSLQVPRACGFAFSSPYFTVPFSLKNIFLEIARTENHIVENPCGDLLHWVNQGVFLLNTFLTTEYDPVLNKGYPDRHKVWECFTTKVVKYLSKETDAIFLIWGDRAKKLVEKHLNRKTIVMYSTHPAADRYGRTKFLGCGHFEKVNKYLEDPIDFKPLTKPIDTNYFKRPASHKSKSHKVTETRKDHEDNKNE